MDKPDMRPTYGIPGTTWRFEEEVPGTIMKELPDMTILKTLTEHRDARVVGFFHPTTGKLLGRAVRDKQGPECTGVGYLGPWNIAPTDEIKDAVVRLVAAYFAWKVGRGLTASGNAAWVAIRLEEMEKELHKGLDEAYGEQVDP